MTELLVIANFIDKYDHTTLYNPGDKLKWDDTERVNDCVNRGLVQIVEKAKKATTKKK